MTNTEIERSTDEELIFFLRNHRFPLTPETHYLYMMMRKISCPLCQSTDYFHNQFHRDENKYHEEVYSNVIKDDVFVRGYSIPDRIEIVYRHLYTHHNDRIQSKERDKARDITVKLIQQLMVFAHNYNIKFGGRKKDKSKEYLERKINLGQCIRFLNKECGIPIRVLEFCFSIRERKLGDYAYQYMKHREGLPSWSQNINYSDSS